MDEPVVPGTIDTAPSVAIEQSRAPTLEGGSTNPEDNLSKVPSKNSIKKAAKAERFAAIKLERRAKEKEAKKLKKRLIAEKRAAGELDDDEEEKNRRKKRPRVHFGGTVVVDLGFDDMMNEKVGCPRFSFNYLHTIHHGFRKSAPCAPSWDTHIARIAMRPTHFPLSIRH
jgi:hypothetical protein